LGKTLTQATAGGFKLRGLRWWIIGLIFLATLINYIDRLTISVLAPVITRDLGLTNTEFGGIITWFLLAYTISQSLSGKLYDRIGTKRGFVCSIILWSVAAMAHAFARGLASLSIFRFVLGLGEAGNWPGAAKTVAEWFPIRERAFGMAIFNSGAAVGSVIAPPLIVWLSLSYGWQTTFIVTGSLGFAWLLLWLPFYQTPDRHKWLSDEERKLIREGQRTEGTEPAELAQAPKWRELLRYRQVWAIVLARFLTDPIWWLYITWLPKYLADARGFSLVKIGLFAWVPYLAADAGSLSGGWLSGYLISRGWSVDRARKVVILMAALLMPAGIFAAFANDAMVALVLIGVVLFGFQVWINNVQTLPSDFFSDKAVASVAGLGGTGAGIGSMIFIFSTGWVVDHFSYVPVLVVAGLLAPFGTLVLFALSGRIQRVSLKPPLRVTTS
jgi:ACS family hexuronate transporter-like MFS transporter